MKKCLAISILTIILFIPIFAHAQVSIDCASDNNSTQLCNPIRYADDVGTFATKAVAIATTFFALIAMMTVIFSGFRMMLSQGDAEKLTVAKNALVWSIFGLVLAMFAFVLVSATADYIGAKDPNPEIYIGNHKVENPINDPSFAKLLGTMTTGFLKVAGLIAIVMIMIGGYRYIASAGNEEMAESGKKTLQWSIVGLITILLSYVLVQATLTFFGA